LSNGCPIPLRSGSRAPDFTAPNERGQALTLSEHMAGGHALLIFYPADWGFICRAEVVEFRDRQAEYEQLGINLVGLSTNMVLSHGFWSESLRLRFPLISDPRGDIASAYGVFDDDEASFNKGRTKRALFLVDAEMVIRFAWVTENQWLEPDYDQVMAACKEALGAPYLGKMAEGTGPAINGRT